MINATQPFLSDIMRRPFEMFDPLDFPTVQRLTRENVKNALEKRFPMVNDRYSLSVKDLRYEGPQDYSLSEQKKAIMEGRSLGTKIRGKWVLADTNTGAVINESPRKTIANIPYLTSRGTYIRNGGELTIGHIMRLRPGVYTRLKNDGGLEAHINVEQGTGSGCRVFMEPSSGVFKLKQGTTNVVLYPLLQAMGVTDDQLNEKWGPDVLNANKKASSIKAASHIADLVSIRQPSVEIEAEAAAEAPVTGQLEKQAADLTHVVDSFLKRKLDPEVTTETLGTAHENVNGALLLDTSHKLLKISKGEAYPDSRDELQFQKVFGPSELFAERILKDGGKVARNLLWKATNKGNLDFMPSGALNQHVDSIFTESKLAQYLDGSNPFSALDNISKITRIGEGGLGDVRMAGDDMRLVHPSFMGFIDPIKTPERMRVGLDVYMAMGARRGTDGKLYTRLYNPANKQMEWIDSVKAAKANIATPEYLNSKDEYLPVARGRRSVTIVPKTAVDYYIPNATNMYSLGSAMVPRMSGVKGQRLLMGAKYMGASLPLVNRESALVKTKHPEEDMSIERSVGHRLGTTRTDQSGQVIKVTDKKITMKFLDGSEKDYELYDNFPANDKGYLRSISRVKPGDVVKKGSVLATTNYTDGEGRAAAGTHLTAAWLSTGSNFEDAVVVSESAAKKLTSENMAHHSIAADPNVNVGKQQFFGAYPGTFSAEQLKKIGDDGLAKPGSVLHHGDPIILAVRNNVAEPGTLGRKTINNISETWHHLNPGVVTDIRSSANKHTVYARYNAPAEVGDKLSARYGGKGVIAEIKPDAEMPQTKDGKPLDLLMTPLGLVSRTNPQSMLEAQLGKIARKYGHAYTMPSFSDDDATAFSEGELKKYGMSDREDVVDPITKRVIPSVFTGLPYVYKLNKTAEVSEAGRGTGGYTVEDTPASGGYEGAKRFGGLETSGLIGHGAWDVIKDGKMLRGQSNLNFWQDFKLGKTPVMPGEPMVHKKFFEHLKGGGINVHKTKDSINLFGMTDTEAQELTQGRELQNTDTFETKTFRPVDGGLFGQDVFGAGGDQWGYIKLDEPVPSPVMSDSIRRILGVSEKDYGQIISGQQDFNGKTGPAAIGDALAKVDLNKELTNTRMMIDKARAGNKDAYIKRYKALKAMIDNEVHPSDFMMTRIPVLPPTYRPISSQGGITMAADSNYLYKKVLEARDDLRDASKDLPTSYQHEARATIYNAYKDLTGLSDPDDAKLQSKNVKGLLHWVFGDNPKTGAFQRRIVASSLDTVGRGVITPNPALRLNQVGLPTSQAWSIYEPFVVRELVKSGYNATDAVKMVANRAAPAYAALQKVAEGRPIIINRAPSLHKFSLMGVYPVLTKGNTLQINPSIVKPFNADFDGDALQFHIPVSVKAAEEIKNKMMPEGNLLDVRKFKAQYTPNAEYVQGLNIATRQKPGPSVKSFNTKEEAIAAYKKGLIDVDDPVTIVEK